MRFAHNSRTATCNHADSLGMIHAQSYARTPSLARWSHALPDPQAPPPGHPPGGTVARVDSPDTVPGKPSCLTRPMLYTPLSASLRIPGSTSSMSPTEWFLLAFSLATCVGGLLWGV
jgi:hypothetical protein